ncbi:MAG: hypothetical protein ACPHXR_04040 [Flavicella sp.]
MKTNTQLTMLFFCIVCMNYAKAQSRKYVYETTISLADLLSFKKNHGLIVNSSQSWDKVSITAVVSHRNDLNENSCNPEDLIALYKAYVDTNSTTLAHKAEEGFLYDDHFDKSHCRVLSSNSNSSHFVKNNTLFVARKLAQKKNESDGFTSISDDLDLMIHLEIEGDVPLADIKEIVLPGSRSLNASDFQRLPDIEVFRSGSDTPYITYNAHDKPLNSLDLQMGDSVVFNSFKKNILIKGLSDIWVAHSAGEVKFYADPSIKMGGVRPFLGFDSQVHGVKLRRYSKEEFERPRYPKMKHTKNNYYSMYWIAQRQQKEDAAPYNPFTDENGNVMFSKVKFATDFGVQNFNIGGGYTVDKQRNNQREGLNMELFNEYYPIKKYSDFNGVKYEDVISYSGIEIVGGMDPDELLYVNQPFASFDNLRSDQMILKQNIEKWKMLFDGEKVTDDPIVMMVSLYQANKTHKFTDSKKEDYFSLYSNIFKYGGREILDKHQNTLDASILTPKAYFNYKLPIVHNETSEGIPEKGEIIFKSKKSSYSIPVNVSVPGTDADDTSKAFKGFYGSISGDMHPSAKEKKVVYSIPKYYLDAPGLYTLKYTFENELGLKKVNEIEFDQNAEAKIDIGFTKYSNGYHDLQLLYRRSKTKKTDGTYKDTPVIVAGKELLPISLRFVSVPGSDGTDFSEDPSIFTANGQVDLKEGRGIGNAWYLGDVINTEKYFMSSGDRDYSVSRTYTFKQGDQVVFSAMDADPHKFIHYETEWYISERAMSKRLTDTDLDKRITWYLTNKRNDANEICFDNLKAMGRHFDYKFTEEPGTYYLRVFYNGVSEMNHKIVIQPASSTEQGNVAFYPLDERHLIWLKEFSKGSEISLPDLGALRIAKVENIHSQYTYVDGIRAPSNNLNNKINRFSAQNDYYDSYDVDCSLQICLDPSNFKRSEEDIAQWFPKNWIRHFSDRPWPLDINASLITSLTSSSLNSANMYVLGSKYEPWQWRFPWVAKTSCEGHKIRWNIKTFYDMNKLFDNDKGAFSGDAYDLLNNASKYFDYDNYVYGPNRDGTGILEGYTELERLKYHFYLDLKHNRKVIFNASLTYEDLSIDFFQKNQNENKGPKVASGIFKYPNSSTGIENRKVSIKNTFDNAQDFSIQLVPNPTKSGKFEVYFHLTNDSFVSVEVLNPIGLTVQNVQAMLLAAGDQFMTIGLDQILLPGIYHVKFKIGIRTIIRKLIVLN